jgi:flagellar protein FliJ
MKKFRFRLETVLRVRRIQEDQARARLLNANAVARKAEAVVGERVARYDALDRPNGVQIEPEFERTLGALDYAASAIDLAREQHIESLAVVAEKRSEWSDASMRVAALERLEARQYTLYATEARRDEDRLTDDLVVNRYAREDRS